jgi:O-antigen ligase
MLAAAIVFAQHPVIGVGPGQYFPFYSAMYHGIYEIKFRDRPGQRRAHNLFLEMGAETGIVGLAVFLTIFIVPARQLWRARRRWLGRDPERAHVAAALFLSLGAYLATGLFLHLAYERYCWFLLGTIGAALQMLKDTPPDQWPAEGASDGHGQRQLA